MFRDPLRFQPVFQQYIWGGRRLETVLKKPIAPEGIFAESWEVVDHGQDQSVVSDGPLKGKTLGELAKSHPDQLIGPSWNSPEKRDSRPGDLKDRFPLLVKWLDANDHLSIQVHPDDHLASALNPPDLGKTEAWYIADAAEGAKIYAGLKEGVTKEEFENAIQEGNILSKLHCFTPKKGDCLFIPAGTVHALGAGLLVAEIQQASNTTYRIYDWDRVDSQGNSRPMHVQQAVEATNYSYGPVSPSRPTESTFSASGTEGTIDIKNLVKCPFFEIDRINIQSGKLTLPQKQCMTVTCTAGSLKVDSENDQFILPLGGTMLVPYQSGSVSVSSESNSSILIGSVCQ